MKQVTKKRWTEKVLFGIFLTFMLLCCVLGLGKSIEGALGGWETSLENQSRGRTTSSGKKETIFAGMKGAGNKVGTDEETNAVEYEAVEAFATKYSLSLSDWPMELLELLGRNPDAEEFVLNYPLKKDISYEVDLTEHINKETVPLLLQWDERWGYTQYGSNVMGLTGCGPTCLSMVCLYLLDDASYSPRYVADFAEKNGYYVEGSGSTWTLISQGGKKLGLDVVEISLDEKRMQKNLEVGNPIICIMGPGDFTTNGHFIVLTGYEDGKFIVNDPNSRTNSNRRWSFEEIKGQVKNLWACRLPQ